MGDKQYAENVAGSGGSGGAGEPADSFTEVATGLRDAEGNMIYKKSYKGTSSNDSFTLIDSDITITQHDLYTVKGRIYERDGNCLNLPTGLSGDWSGTVNIRSTGLNLELGASVRNKDYYVTVYYIHKPVPRATSRKKTSED